MSDKKTTEKCGCKNCKCENCNCGRSLMPICFLVCALTAVLVALIFSISFTAIFTTELRHKYGNTYAGQFDKDINTNYDDMITGISAGGVIDFFESGQTGFLLVLELNQERSSNFYGDVLTELNATDTKAQTYAFTYDPESGDQQANDYARSITLGDSEDAPALLYVRNGKIHDRLDSIYDSSILNTFISKYRATVAGE